jgi:hypothetical protein
MYPICNGTWITVQASGKARGTMAKNPRIGV